MDNIVAKVIEKLNDRQQNSLSVSLSSNQTFSKKQLLYHEHIIVKNVQIDQLYQLANHEKTEWVGWVNEGLSLCNKFHFHLEDGFWQLVPDDLLLKWPIYFYDSHQVQILSVREHVITYETVANLPDNSKLIKFKRQLLTDYAKEICLKKNIAILRRI